jgi:hypothetical protein
VHASNKCLPPVTAFGKDPGNPARIAQVSEYLRSLSPDRYPDLVAVADDLTARLGMTHRFEVGLTGLDCQRSAPPPETTARHEIGEIGQPPSGDPPHDQ